MKVLAYYRMNCGRMGDIDGLFVCEDSQLEEAYGKKVYFGEVLGKHSEIFGTLDREEIEIKTTDQTLIENFVAAMKGETNLCGYNPLDYLEGHEE